MEDIVEQVEEEGIAFTDAVEGEREVSYSSCVEGSQNPSWPLQV